MVAGVSGEMSRRVCEYHYGGKSGLCSSSGFTGGLPGSASVFLKDPGYTPASPLPLGLVIDLLSDAALPRGHVYPLSYSKTEAMENYVQESQQQSFISPSKSSASSSFFFVKKKDGGLCPCIDYRTLNKATVNFSYPLPLIPTIIEQMHGAQYFTKLDLRSAYNLVRIRAGDEWKTAFFHDHGSLRVSCNALWSV